MNKDRLHQSAHTLRGLERNRGFFGRSRWRACPRNAWLCLGDLQTSSSIDGQLILPALDPIHPGRVRQRLLQEKGLILTGPPLARWVGLEVEPYLGGEGSRGHVVGAAEGGKKVVQRVLVCQIDRGQLQADFATVIVKAKQVVISNG